MSATDPEPRRLTPTERLQLADTRLHEITMASLSRRPSEPESSVSLTRNAKGAVQIEVTVRGSDARSCQQHATLLYEELALAYPYPVTNGGPE